MFALKKVDTFYIFYWTANFLCTAARIFLLENVYKGLAWRKNYPKPVHPDICNGHVNKMQKIKTRHKYIKTKNNNDCDKHQCLDT